MNVTDVTPGPIVERVSTNARFKIEGDIPDGLPPALCAKGYFSEAGAGQSPGQRARGGFYRDLAHPIGVRTLNSVWADIDPATDHGVVITQDAVEAGAVFCDALDVCTVERVADQLGEFAKLHAYAWEQPEIVTAQPGAGAAAAVHPERAWAEGDQRQLRRPQRRRRARRHAHRAGASSTRTATWPRTRRGRAGRSRTATRTWATRSSTAQGRGCLLDWQVTQFAPWWIDVGYHIASALEPDVRAANERDLLQHYLDALGAAGVTTVPSWDDAWDGYRKGVVHGFFLWGITVYVRPEVIAQLLRRLGTAADELGSYELLAEHVVMTSASERERFEDLYDVERHVMATDGGILVEDPYPAFAELLDAAPVHEGSVRELLGYERGGLSLLRDGPTYTAMSYEANDTVLREN